MSVNWLSKKKKSELTLLCDHLGLETDGTYRKTDLEALLTQYLQANEKSLSSDSIFAAYYESLARSPTKRSSISTATATAIKTEDGAAAASRARRRTTTANSFAYDDAGSTYSEAESTPDRTTRSGSRSLSTRTPRTIRSLREADAAATQLLPTPLRDAKLVQLSRDSIKLTYNAPMSPMSPAVVASGVSPAAVADGIEDRANALMAVAREAVERSEITETARGVRDRLANVISVNVASLALEATLLLVAVIPVTYELTLPAMEAVGYESATYVLPDLFVLLTATFWAPFLVWLLTAVVLPGINAVVFNLVATSAREGGEYKADPLTYAVTRVLCVYLVHYKGFTGGGLLGQAAVATVGTNVGRELQLIGAGIGGIAALWVGILSRR